MKQVCKAIESSFYRVGLAHRPAPSTLDKDDGLLVALLVPLSTLCPRHSEGARPMKHFR